MKKIITRYLSVLAIVTIIVLGFIPFSYAHGPGAAWQYYRTIGLNPVTPSADFQVEVHLSAGQYTNMNSDGSDLRFYDNANTNCEYWIEVWNNAGTSTIWVKVPTSGTNVLVMYYGNASAAAVSNGNNTFIFFDDFTAPLGVEWSTITSGGSVTQSGTNVTLSNTNGGTVEISNTNPFPLVFTSWLLETKHREPAYNRNRFYAATYIFQGNPLGFDNGLFYIGSGPSATAQVFWNGAFYTTVNANTDYVSQWRITDGSTYNWYLYSYAAGIGSLLDSRTGTTNVVSRYITIGVTEVAGTSTVVDWVRVRKYTATEPAGSVGSETDNSAPSNPYVTSSSGYFLVPNGVTSIKVECWGGGGGGSTITSSTLRGGGGGGGAYAGSNVSVTGDILYPYTVGTGGAATIAGGNSSFNNTTVVAAGGTGGAFNSTTGGDGGTVANSTGTTRYRGGNGADGGGTYSGGGGGGAGTTGEGGDAPTPAAGSHGNGTTLYGGDGGGSVSGNSAGNNGSDYGGGGSGAVTNYNSTDRTGGSGTNGQVIITCITPDAPTVTSQIKYCLNATAVPLTATGINLLWYTQPSGGTGSSTAPTPSTSAPGTTSYYVSQTAWCESPRATINVEVEQPLATITGQTNPLCNAGNDGSITVTASSGTAPYSFSKDGNTWVTPGTNPYTFTGLNANTQYRIKVKDSLGCESR